MKIRFVILFFLLCISSGVSHAQTAADSTVQKRVVSSEVEEAEKSETVEKVDGVWALSEYLGKKLVREFSSRLNLDRDDNQGDPKPVKVAISIGSFRVERTEFR